MAKKTGYDPLEESKISSGKLVMTEPPSLKSQEPEVPEEPVLVVPPKSATSAKYILMKDFKMFWNKGQVLLLKAGDEVSDEVYGPGGVKRFLDEHAPIEAIGDAPPAYKPCKACNGTGHEV
jgi:hypothetical protein